MSRGLDPQLVVSPPAGFSSLLVTAPSRADVSKNRRISVFARQPVGSLVAALPGDSATKLQELPRPLWPVWSKNSLNFCALSKEKRLGRPIGHPTEVAGEARVTHEVDVLIESNDLNSVGIFSTGPVEVAQIGEFRRNGQLTRTLVERGRRVSARSPRCGRRSPSRFNCRARHPCRTRASRQ
jgi:hypothetical protein